MFFKINKVENRVKYLAKLIGAPKHLLPTFGFSKQSGLPHIEIDGDIYHFVVCERGSELKRKTTSDLKELVFWIFDSVTFSMACDLELKNRRKDEDFRIQLFQIQERLISNIDADYALILKNKHDKLLNIK